MQPPSPLCDWMYVPECLVPLAVVLKDGRVVVDVFHRHAPSPLRLGVDAVRHLDADLQGGPQLLTVHPPGQGEDTGLGVDGHEGLRGQADGVGEVAVEIQVWSLTQFYSVDFNNHGSV